MNQFTQAMFTALLLASSSLAVAQDYPASDFKPKVIFSDNSATPASSSSTATKATAPAEVDPNYPAANYQPKVLFNDTAYKHSATAPNNKAGSAASAEAVEGTESAPAAHNNNLLLGLGGLAVVAFVLSRKNSCAKKAAKPQAASNVTTDNSATGVEKYLQKQGFSKTGVAKYLEKQVANPSTGVTKYLAKVKVKDREAAAAKTTGVERYLRDKV